MRTAHLAFSASFLLLATTLAVPDVTVFDNIGANDGSGIDTAHPKTSSQVQTEKSLSPWDVMALAPFSIDAPTTMTSVEIVLYEGFMVSPDGVESLNIAIYSSPEAAGASLSGDLYNGMQLPFSISSDWEGPGYLLSADIEVSLSAGNYFLGIAPYNNSLTNGDTWVREMADPTASDIAYQANPSGSWGFGDVGIKAFGGIALAYRLTAADTVPCGIALPTPCPEDVDGNGSVDIFDLLTVLETYWDEGSKSERPAGDCAPAPNGDCTVNTTDLLAVLAAWGNDCSPIGACCAGGGSCSEMISAAECASLGGIYGGDQSACVDMSCEVGACCTNSSTCDQLTESACVTGGGNYKGDGVGCGDVDCLDSPVNDSCSGRLALTLGLNPSGTFKNTSSGDSTGGCTFAGDGQLSYDIYWDFTAPDSGLVQFSTCDICLFNSLMVVYDDCPADGGTAIACGGPETGCGLQTNVIEIQMTKGDTVVLRLGGADQQNGNNCGILVRINPAETGACCLDDGSCVDGIFRTECADMDGVFHVNDTCGDVSCSIDVPSNDTCEMAETIGEGTTMFDNRQATTSGESHPDVCTAEGAPGQIYGDVWYLYTPMTNGDLTVSTCGMADFDTGIALYTGDCGSLVLETCNDDGQGCTDYTSYLSWPVTAGTVYTIRVGGMSVDNSGMGSVSVSTTPTDPAACCVNGECIDNMTKEACFLLNGSIWHADMACGDVTCPSLAFTIETEPYEGDFGSMIPMIQSGFAARLEGTDTWLLGGGRINGFHGFNFPWSLFPRVMSNHDLWVIDFTDRTAPAIYSLPLDNITDDSIRQQFFGANFNRHQSGEWLYLSGGYGELDNGDRVTHNILTRIHVPTAIDAIKNRGDINTSLETEEDWRFGITGGGLIQLDDGTWALAVGQNFTGVYALNQATQVYPRTIRLFELDGVSIVDGSYHEYSDWQYNRRDLNVTETLMMDGSKGLGVYGGVFQPNFLPDGGPNPLIDLPGAPANIPMTGWTHPIYVGTGLPPQLDDAFQQKMSQYECGVLLMAEPVGKDLNNMYTTFLGGIGAYEYDYSTETFVQASFSTTDDPLPWTNSITTVARWYDGITTETVHTDPLPGWLGADADFLPWNDIAMIEGEIIDLSALTERTEVGLLYGGIEGFPFNEDGSRRGMAHSPSIGSQTILRVFVTPNE
jgi:hypothetical protein